MSSGGSVRFSRTLFCVFVGALALLLGVGGPGSCQRPFEIEILSSTPDQVSGGDALVRVQGAGLPQSWSLRLNGVDVTDALAPVPEGGALEGVVSGFTLGQNLLELKPHPNASAVVASLVVHNHPAQGPIFSGPQQQPFVCTTARVGLGQPIVDNQDAIGIPVAQEDENGSYPSDGRGYPTAEAQIVGWSKDCAAERHFEYVYRTTGGSFESYDPGAPLPGDAAMTTTLDGHDVPYIVRWERGTINRFVYSVAMLAPAGEADPSAPDDSLWNGRLVFSLQGGVAIGRHQGTTSTGAMLPDDVLKLGYAVVNSTGLRTNTHYNLQLGGETALMLKEHFIEDHGVPLYSVGVGGSGGAIQQYVYAQNHPGLLDAAIPQYSYSDMITQTIHVGDCELLENYFDATDRFNPKWQDVLNRRAIQGLNASRMPSMSEGEADDWNLLYLLYGVLGLNAPVPEPGSMVPAITECRRAWFGLTPLTLNPTFTNVSDLDKLAQGVDGVDWTHAGDLVNIYGEDETGFARNAWDNVGVQYGLQALVDGVITPAEFLDLNAQVGSWKEPSEMVAEGFPFVGGFDPFNFDPWSARNMNLSPDGGVTPAPRRSGDIPAINAAYETVPGGRARHAPQPPVLRHAQPTPECPRRRGQPGDLVHRRTALRGLRPDARGVRGDRRVDGESAGEPRARRGRQPPDAGGGPLLRHARQRDRSRRRRLERHSRRRVAGDVHATVPDPPEHPHRGRWPDRRRHLQVRPPVRRRGHRGRRLRLLAAEHRRAGAPVGDLPGRRLRLGGRRRRATLIPVVPSQATRSQIGPGFETSRIHTDRSGERADHPRKRSTSRSANAAATHDTGGKSR
jgi:hypothetical protein